jgi:hypothetical protein
MRVAALADFEAAGLVTENGNTVGEIMFGGTIALIVFVGGLGGMLGSIVVVGAEPWLRWMGPLRGLRFGLAVLAAFGSSDRFDSPDFTILEPPELIRGHVRRPLRCIRLRRSGRLLAPRPDAATRRR